MFDLHIHITNDDKILKEIKDLIIVNNQKQNTIMATLAEVQQQVVDLQATVDAEQAQIALLLEGQNATIVSLNEQIAQLQALVDAAPTPEQLQEVVNSLITIKTDIEGTVA